jgi:hypothetical protein
MGKRTVPFIPAAQTLLAHFGKIAKRFGCQHFELEKSLRHVTHYGAIINESIHKKHPG